MSDCECDRDRDRDRFIRLLEEARAALEFVLSDGMLGMHEAHRDRQGAHGVDCPACRANAAVVVRVRATLELFS